MVDLPNMVASAIESERSQFSVAVLLSNNSITTKKIREILPKKMRLVTLTSSTKVRENLEELGLEVEMLEDSLSSQGLSVLNNLHDIILQGLGEGKFASNDRILAILAEPMNGVVVIEANSLASNKLAIIANEHGVDIEVLARTMELARQIGGEVVRDMLLGLYLQLAPFQNLDDILLLWSSIHSKDILIPRKM